MWYRIKSFLKFYFLAGTKYNVHSAFLYDFVYHVLDTTKEYYVYQQLELLRKELLHNEQLIDIKDFGAGSHQIKGNTRMVKDIAATSLSGKSKCRILFQLAEHYQCNTILELGTSLGISSSYLASTGKDKTVVTLEGDESIASIAKDIHKKAGLSHIKIITGPFYETLSPTLQSMPDINLVFLDGHHQYDATLSYFKQIITKSTSDSIIIIDDIYWSEGMTKAWREISQHAQVSLALDLYDIGIVFLNPNLSKQYIRYISYKYKPWRIGFFA
jgi:predicted O-methyltransferase YrrM